MILNVSNVLYISARRVVWAHLQGLNIKIQYSPAQFLKATVLNICNLSCDHGCDHCSRILLAAPRKVLRIPNTDPTPFALCEFCKSMQTHGNGPHGPEKQVYRNSEVRRSGARCAAGCCIKSVKKCISCARAPRGHDAWGVSIHIKSDSTAVLSS
jgi:hypothetical protein